MPDISSQPKRRRFWPWALAVVLVCWIMLIGHTLWPSTVPIGSTAAQVIERLGQPTLAFVTRPPENDTVEALLQGEPVWSRMQQPARDQLLASKEFRLHYNGSILSEGFAVTFRNGRVVRTEQSSR